MRVATFNMQNLRLRAGRLDGARDADGAPDGSALRHDDADRRLGARLIAEAAPDVIALQEVFDRAALDFFHDRLLAPLSELRYPHRVCLPGNDGRGQDIALMSCRPLAEVKGHAALTPRDLNLEAPRGMNPSHPVFRRDCLTARAGALTLFVCHFKAPWPRARKAWAVRRLEAQAVRRLVERRFDDPASALWLVLGDLNDPMDGPEPAIAPLLPPFSVDLLARLPPDERWSWHDSDTGTYGRPDALLASPALAGRFPAARPRLHRAGLGHEAQRHHGHRFAATGWHRPHASDHALVAVDFPGL
ncbi:endonuclease/exonuclease/phosphatase family protein [Rhodosalinus sp.]|uniref:endonuclease/exonuclease/phosphatase family protein n=1 Tax=Rhodosalinus sp. TaxID=2047741 RepID=UPI00397D6F68